MRQRVNPLSEQPTMPMQTNTREHMVHINTDTHGEERERKTIISADDVIMLHIVKSILFACVNNVLLNYLEQFEFDISRNKKQ